MHNSYIPIFKSNEILQIFTLIRRVISKDTRFVFDDFKDMYLV